MLIENCGNAKREAPQRVHKLERHTTRGVSQTSPLGPQDGPCFSRADAEGGGEGALVQDVRRHGHGAELGVGL